MSFEQVVKATIDALDAKIEMLSAKDEITESKSFYLEDLLREWNELASQHKE